MRKAWLLFSQTVTVAVALLFVVATLKPQWLPRGSHCGFNVATTKSSATATVTVWEKRSQALRMNEGIAASHYPASPATTMQHGLRARLPYCLLYTSDAADEED